MSNYTKTTNFTAKDSLTTGDPNKVIRGSEHDTEYSAIAVAVATKEDSANKNAASGYAGLDGSSHLATTVMPAFTGDVTSSAGAVALTIANSAVTLAKMANLAAATIIGRQSGAGTGVPQALAGSDVATIVAAAGLPTSAITSGTFADARIASTNVTQHQASLAIATSQVTSGTFADARIAQTNVTQHQAALALATSQITSGTFADARIAASNVTQHQASLSIGASQLTGTLADARVASSNVTQYQSSFKGRNISGKSGTSFTIQSGGTASGGSDGDIIGIY